MSLITSSFGHGFYLNNGDDSPKQSLIESPVKKRMRPPELQNIAKAAFGNEMVIDWGDGYFSDKKSKVNPENAFSQDLFDSDFLQIAALYSLLNPEINSDDFINEFDHVDVKEQAKLILNSAPFQNYPDTEKKRIRSIIRQVPQNFCFDVEAQCAELGVLYFYIASKEVLNDSFFLQYRIQELVQEAQDLITQHNIFCPQYLRGQVPTGCKAYLLLAFVRMIFPADGAFNPGGCKALKMMMQSPLQNMISEEERLQIIRIADKLLVDEEFTLLFKEPFPIHQDIEELISIDLQLPKDEAINFIYLRWDLLIALVSSISQHDGEINCFTVAAVSNFLVNSPKIMLKMLIETFKTGKMEFEGRMFSVSTLLESSRRNETDFMYPVSYEDISGLIPFSLARDCLSVDEMKALTTKNMLLNSYMALQFGSEAERAKQLYLSLKQNLLQKLLISMVQFAAINTNSLDFHADGKSSMKERLIHSFMNQMYSYIKTNSNEALNQPHTVYLEELSKAFLENLYFVDYNNWYATNDGNNVSFNFHKKGLKYNGQNTDYFPFIHERRLCFFKNGDLIPIDSISELKSCLLEIAIEFDLDINISLNNSPHAKVVDFINSNNFDGVISTALYELNKAKSPISSDMYKDTDSLFVAQAGSEPVFLETWSPLSSEITSLPIIAVDPADFFVLLCDELAEHAKSSKEFKETKKWVLIRHDRHLYNLCPHLFKEYWGSKNKNIDHKILDEKILSRANKCKFTTEAKSRVLLNVVGKTTMENHYEDLLYSDYDAAQFSREAKKLLPTYLHAVLDITINKVMYEIPVAEIKKGLKTILKGILNASVEPCLTMLLQRIEEIESAIPYFSPYDLSKLIYNALVASNNTMGISRDYIEKSIRRWASLPEVIDIGNMNWTDSLSELPTYCYFSIMYDFTKGLSFCYRKNGVEAPLDVESTNRILKETVLYFPK